MEQLKQTVSKMSLSEYQSLALRTAKDMGSPKWDLAHAALGLTTDAGEAADVIKAHVIYNKELDASHLVEELGDLLWFTAFAASLVGYDLDSVAKLNIHKLQKRYPDKYSDEHAIARRDKSSPEDGWPF